MDTDTKMSFKSIKWCEFVVSEDDAKHTKNIFFNSNGDVTF